MIVKNKKKRGSAWFTKPNQSQTTTYISMRDLATEALVTRAERLIKIECRSWSQVLPNDFDLVLHPYKLLPDFPVVLHGLPTEGKLARWRTILQPLTAKLACVVLVNGHKSCRELAVLEEPINVTIHAMEEQVAVIVRGRHVHLLEGQVELVRIQVTFVLLVEEPESVDKVEILAQGQIDLL